MIILTWLLHVTLSIAAPLALAIAAIITPTDATAFDSVIEGRKIRRVIRDTLKTESLFNDATGIVLLQAAMLWLQKGQLVIGQNLLDFLK
ncbi:cation:proton antiporter [Pediococcus acidilactici]